MGLDIGISVRLPDHELVDEASLEGDLADALIDRFGMSNGRYCRPTIYQDGQDIVVSVRLIGRGWPLMASGHEPEEILDVLAEAVRKRFGVTLVEVWSDG